VQPFARLSVYSSERCGRHLHQNPFIEVDRVPQHSSVLWRQWRSMAPRASRSAGISRFDGLLAPAAELCRIVRASYLSPSFPFFLCFELWRYLYSTRRGRRPRRKVTRSSAGSPSFLRLLRGAALAVTLMLPAEGWAQGALPAAPAVAQGNAVAQPVCVRTEKEQRTAGRKTSPGGVRRTADRSATLRSGRDDKGKGSASMQIGCCGG
jgi:hypothetical protein